MMANLPDLAQTPRRCPDCRAGREIGRFGAIPATLRAGYVFTEELSLIEDRIIAEPEDLSICSDRRALQRPA
jgi:hypothetical protein